MRLYRVRIINSWDEWYEDEIDFTSSKVKGQKVKGLFIVYLTKASSVAGRVAGFSDSTRRLVENHSQRSHLVFAGAVATDLGLMKKWVASWVPYCLHACMLMGLSWLFFTRLVVLIFFPLQHLFFFITNGTASTVLQTQALRCCVIYDLRVQAGLLHLPQ